MSNEENKLKVATVESFRSKLKETKTVCVPSGVLVEVRRLTPMDYIEAGFKDLPNEFFKFVAQLASGNADPNNEDDKRNYELYEKFLKTTVELGIVSPPTILTYDESKKDTHLIFGEFTEVDQKFLIDVISGRSDG